MACQAHLTGRLLEGRRGAISACRRRFLDSIDRFELQHPLTPNADQPLNSWLMPSWLTQATAQFEAVGNMGAEPVVV